MIKSYLLKPRFSSFDISNNKFFVTEKTLIDQSKDETWYLNKFNKTNKLTIKKTINGEAVYNEEIIDEKVAEKLLNKSKNNTVAKKVYTIELPNIQQKTKIEYYLNELKGLVVLSVCFNNEKEAENFKLPTYAIKDITNDDYYNFINLSKVTFEDIEKKENFKRFYTQPETRVETY